MKLREVSGKFLLVIVIIIVSFSVNPILTADSFFNAKCASTDENTTDLSIKGALPTIEMENVSSWDNNYDVPIKIEKYGNYLFSGYQEGDNPCFDVFNITDISSIEYVKTLKTDVYTYAFTDFVIIDDRLIIGLQQSRNYVYRITGTLDLVSEDRLPYYLSYMDVVGDYIFGFTVSDSNIYNYNFTTPSAPIATEAIHSSDYNLFPAHLFIKNGLLFVENGYLLELLVFNITNPVSPEFLGREKTNLTTDSLDGAANNQIAVVNTFVGYKTNASQGLFAFNLTDPLNPTFLNNYSYTINGFAAEPLSLLIFNDTLYIADYIHGLQIINITDITNFQLIDTIALEGLSRIQILDDLLYAYGLFKEIKIYNITNILSPVEISAINLGGTTTDSYIHSNYGYITNSEDGFYVVNLTDNGKIIFHYNPLNDSVKYVWANDELIICSLASGFLNVFDNSDSENPLLITEYNIGNELAKRISIQGNYLYAIDNDSNFLIIDFANPYSIETKASINLLNVSYNDLLNSLQIKNNYAYILYYDYLVVYDISNKTHPEFVSEYLLDGIFVQIVINENFAYLTNFLGRCVEILDIRDSNNLMKHSNFTVNALPTNLHLSEDKFLYVTTRSGYDILYCDDEKTPVLIHRKDNYWLGILGTFYDANGYLIITNEEDGYDIFSLTKTFNLGSTTNIIPVFDMVAHMFGMMVIISFLFTIRQRSKWKKQSYN